MRCQHGFEKENCPVCRISNNTKPDKFIQKEEIIKTHPLNQHGQFFKKILEEREQGKKEIEDMPHKDKSLRLDSRNPFKSSPSLNKLPSFKNKMFVKRFNEIQPNSLSKFNLSKKISLESPEWRFEEYFKTQSENKLEKEENKN
ncbi:MAG: hypothetical protein EU541_07815 [Promethearchaeota archaeon]|nr:MAG: hypothetical protein EU541_07815 [Candidatus Lokiarchaeota archaeon]